MHPLVGEIGGFLRRERSALTSVFLSNLLLGFAGVVSGFALARTLGPDGRGVLGSMQALPTLVAGLVLLGFHEAVAYWGIRQPARARSYLTAALVISGTLAVVVAVLLLVSPFGLVDRSWAHQAYVWFIVVTPLTQVPLYILQAADRFTAWSVLRSTTTMAWLLIALITVALPGTRSPYFVATSYLCTLVLLVPVFLRMGYRATEPSGLPVVDDVRQLLRFGLPVMLTAAPLALNLRLDIVVVSSQFPDTKIGYYVAAVAWSALVTPVFNTLSVLALPLVARRQARGEASDARLIVGLAFGLCAVVAVTSVPLTRIVFPLVFGRLYEPATDLASLALVVGAIHGTREVMSSTFRGLGRVRVPLLAELIGLMVTLATLWAFLDRFGLAGGQYSSLGAYGITLLILVAVALLRPSSVSTDGAAVPPSDDTHRLKRSRPWGR